LSVRALLFETSSSRDVVDEAMPSSSMPFEALSRPLLSVPVFPGIHPDVRVQVFVVNVGTGVDDGDDDFLLPLVMDQARPASAFFRPQA